MRGWLGFLDRYNRCYRACEEVYSFTTLDKMVATSDVVVEARVVDKITGPDISDSGESDDSVGFDTAVLDITRLFYAKGSLPIDDSDQVALVELARDGGESIILNNVQPSKVGDAGFYFLTQDSTEVASGDPLLSFVLIGSQGRYLISGGAISRFQSRGRACSRAAIPDSRPVPSIACRVSGTCTGG